MSKYTVSVNGYMYDDEYGEGPYTHVLDLTDLKEMCWDKLSDDWYYETEAYQQKYVPWFVQMGSILESAKSVDSIVPIMGEIFPDWEFGDEQIHIDEGDVHETNPHIQMEEVIAHTYEGCPYTNRCEDFPCCGHGEYVGGELRAY